MKSSSYSLSINQIQTHIINQTSNTSSQRLKNQLRNNKKNNRVYGKNQSDSNGEFIPTYYKTPLYYGGEPYFCPNGWKRYSLDVGANNKQFKEKYQDWPVCYHGTSSAAIFSIFQNGFKANYGCWLKDKSDRAVYLTPSIIYASHPRYAKIEKCKKMHAQFILQLRVRKDLFFKEAGTLQNAKKNCNQRIDPNFSNKQLQWVCKWNKNSTIKSKDGILIYGIMVKISAENPLSIQQNKWYSTYLRNP